MTDRLGLRGGRAASLRWIVQLALGLYTGTLLVFVAIEMSIDGGMASVVLPGQDIGDPRVAWAVDAYDLDQPVVIRHARWVGDAVQGDLRRSLRTGTPVDEVLAPRLPISFEIAMVSLGAAVAIGIPAGVAMAVAGWRRGGWLLRIVVGTAQSTPGFILATIGTGVLAVRFGWFPASGWVRPSNSISGNIEHLMLPVLAIALPEAAIIARIVSTSLVAVLGEEYVVAARAKGLPARTVLFRHALRPACFTVVTQVGLVFGSLLGGVIVVERVFGIGGVGRVLEEAALQRDLHVLAAITAGVLAVVFTVRGLSEVVYRWADPRVR